MLLRAAFAGFSVLLVGLAIGLTPAPAEADTLDSIMAAKVIKIAVPQDFAPFGSAGLDLKPQGYDIDMANLIGKALGVKVELIPVTSANRIPYLQTHKADLVISSLGKNAEREKVIDFSIAYAPFFSAVYSVKGKDAGITKLEDLAGKTVGAARGTIEEQALTASAPKDTTIKRFEDNNATISAFVSGQVDLVATGNTVAAVIAERSPRSRPRDEISDQGQSLLCRLEQGRAEAAGQGQRDHRQGESVGRDRETFGEVAQAAFAAGFLTQPRAQSTPCSTNCNSAICCPTGTYCSRA